MEFIIYDSWLYDTEVDIEAFQQLLESWEGGYEEVWNGEDHGYKFTAPDTNHDNIPDFLAGIITEPVNMNVSQGGAYD